MVVGMSDHRTSSAGLVTHHPSKDSLDHNNTILLIFFSNDFLVNDPMYTVKYSKILINFILLQLFTINPLGILELLTAFWIFIVPSLGSSTIFSS